MAKHYYNFSTSRLVAHEREKLFVQHFGKRNLQFKKDVMQNAITGKHWKVLVVTFLPICFVINNAQSQQTIPASYPAGTPVNYVRTWDPIAPDPDGNSLMIRPLKDVKVTTQYIDGQGRPLQTVVREGSLATGSSATDMVSSNIYDVFGRETVKYMAYSDATNTGAFKTNPFNPQVGFYNTQLAGQAGETTANNTTPNWAYSQTRFEASPLNRPQENFAPGVNWAGSEGQSLEVNRRSVKVKHWVNTATDAVRTWAVTNAGMGSFGSYATASTYAAGELYKTIKLDEHNKQVIEFTDKDGKVILKKVQIDGSGDNGAGVGHTTDWLCTYYIYDIQGQLRCVIQPEGVKAISSTWTLTSTLLAEQCFRYEYDHRGQLIMKKVPGQGHIDLIYDKVDRLVMTQDEIQRNAYPNRWSYTEYDGLSRPVKTGIFEWNTNAQNFRNFARLYSNYPWDHFAPSGITPEILTVTHYDDYSSLPSPLGAYSTSWDSHFSALTTTWPYPQTPAASTATKGRVTWTSTRILGSSNFLHAVNYYDEKGRVIQVQSSNTTGAVDVLSTQYTWAGLPYIMVQKQQNSNGTAQTAEIVTKNTYDDLSRLVKIEKKLRHTLVNSNAWSNSGNFNTIAEMEYDKLGQLKKKKLAPAYNSNAGLESLLYDYNIRGWMLGMNRWFTRDEPSPFGGAGGTYFGFDLGYEKTNNGLINSQAYAAAQYNGNITGTVWKSKGDGEKRKYDFAYDNANRLLKADFNQYTGGSFNQSGGVNYNVKMGDGTTHSSAYDANGNIKRMQQWGLKLNSSVQVDDLTYNYEISPGQFSNKLFKVTDAVTTENKLGDFYNGTSGTSTDYTYDVNGNMISDLNKNISSITYNHLNLPNVITVTGKGTITYTYDAAGNKLKKVVAETGQPVKTTLYIAGAVYENDVLQFLGQEEGRIRFKPQEGSTAASLQNDYFIKDHLGNVRMVLTEEQKQQFYPAATLENDSYNGGTAISAEDDFYTVNTGNIVAQSTATGMPGYANNNSPIANPNTYSDQTINSKRLYLLNATGGAVNSRTGLGIVLKVMSGDKLNLFSKSYHKKPGGGYTNPVNSLTVANIIDLLTGTTLITSKGVSSSQITSAANFPSTIAALLNNPPAQSSSRPRAGINWLILDEQFKFVSGGFDPVEDAGSSTTGTLKDHILIGIVIPKNGYFYAWCSNESQYDVFFDNFQAVHDRGNILEETHYYAFGLAMAGISSKAAGLTTNKEKTFQDQRFDDELGLNWVQFKWRNHDPQIGRFIEIDPLSEKYDYNSTYAFSENKVIVHRELEGLEGVRFNEFDEDGKLKKIVIEKNVVVMVRPKKESNSEKQNEKIDKQNAAKVEKVTKELNSYFNGNKGVTNSAKVPVEFKFNVTTVPDNVSSIKSKSERDNEYAKIAASNVLMGTAQVAGPTSGGVATTQDRPVGAAVITAEPPTGFENAGEASGGIVRMYSEQGVTAHEILHTLGADDNGYNQGGLLGRPPGKIIQSEVDIIIKASIPAKL